MSIVWLASTWIQMLFMQSATVMLADIPSKIFKRILQVPHIASLGWSLAPMKILLLKILTTAPRCSGPTCPHQSPPVQYGLNFKPIWDGSLQAECKKDKSHNKWAIHIDAIVEIAQTSNALLKKHWLLLGFAHTPIFLPIVRQMILNVGLLDTALWSSPCQKASPPKSFCLIDLFLHWLMQHCIPPLWPSQTQLAKIIPFSGPQLKWAGLCFYLPNIVCSTGEWLCGIPSGILGPLT